ncbi:MAG: glycosyltransferase, partial [Bacteroidaceae bacterium]|nr:glycosyltransferase [Bacteroidaceae bacterium]
MMKTKPSVSVCMPMYNASPYLRECVDSILSQSFEDFELLIVDDGSTDDSVEIVRSYGDERIRLIENKHDYIGSLNILLDEARGKYIARMDADDVMMPERLQAQYDYMECHPSIDLVASGMNYIGNGGRTFVPPVTDRCINPKDLLESCCIAHPTVFVRTDVFKKHDLRYREEYKFAEDYRLWAEMLMSGLHLTNIGRPLINYRVSCS